MVFLHASPNILKDFDIDKQKFGATSLQQLNFRQEQAKIKETLQDTSCKISFRAQVATKEAFSKTINEMPTVLHISCHGTYVEDKKRRPNMIQYLVFENAHGGGDMVSE